MATTNYKFEKRQRDIAKAKKQDEKRQKKLARTGQAEPPAAPPAAPPTEPAKD
jgi:hypothetical protein